MSNQTSTRTYNKVKFISFNSIDILSFNQHEEISRILNPEKKLITSKRRKPKINYNENQFDYAFELLLKEN